MAGEAIEFSAADLAATAAAYNPTLARAPLVVGHPKTDDPAQGWAAGLSAGSQGLYAQVEQLDPAFAEAVRAGRYAAVSAKFYRPDDANNPAPGVWYLRHIGFLGAMPPAVKGLEPPAFAQAAAFYDIDTSHGDGVCFAEPVAFSGWAGMQQAGLWRNLRDWLLAKWGAEEADRVVPSYQVQDLEMAARHEMDDDGPAAVPAFAEAAAAPAPAAEPPATPTEPQEPAVTEAEAQQLREQNAALQRDADELRRREAERTAAAVLADNTAFAEQLVREARIPAGQAALVAAVGVQLQQAADVQFGEGDARVPVHQAFRSLLSALPPLAGTGEQATRERAAEAGASAQADAEFSEADPDRLALDGQIKAYAAKHGMSYAQAAAAVVRSTR